MNIISVVGARPQFIKSFAVSQALQRAGVAHGLVHTGQHYDHALSQTFFDQLELPDPVINLGVGSSSSSSQIARIMLSLEDLLIQCSDLPEILLVYGDTNSSLAAALVGSKLGVPIAHVEAGERCRDRNQPEEINRTLIDHMSSLLFCSSERALSNLAGEGISQGVHLSGDVMLDTLNQCLAKVKSRSILQDLGLVPKSYYLATVHRAESTDDESRLRSIFDALASLKYPVILPLHPRTRKMLERFSLPERRNHGSRILLIDPVSYLDMLELERSARIILTDSGGMQKEAYWLRVPCVVLSETTAWMELVELGCNALAGTSSAEILSAVDDFEVPLDLGFGRGDLYGTGCSAEGIARILSETDL